MMPTTHYPLPTRRSDAAAYTPQQRAEMAAAFKAAKPYLDQYGFICFFGGYTVASWLVNQGVLLANSEQVFDLLPYRHRWLDSLIAEFSNP